MMDGLVSTGKFLSRHNIKNNFFYNKKISKKFYSHFKNVCGKGLCRLHLNEVPVESECINFIHHKKQMCKQQ